MMAEGEDRDDVRHAARHLSDLSGAKPPAAPEPPPRQPAWRRRMTSPTARMAVFGLMSLDGLWILTERSHADHTQGWIFLIGGPIAFGEALLERRRRRS